MTLMVSDGEQTTRANMMKAHKLDRIFQGLFAMILLGSLCAANAQSSSTSSANPKPVPEAQSRQSTKSDSGNPPASTGKATSEDPGTDPIDEDIRKLHMLAAELREEVGKTYKESLSVNVLKKAKEIEALSRSLKERMDQKAAATRHR